MNRTTMELLLIDLNESRPTIWSQSEYNRNEMLIHIPVPPAAT
jgi:hypothetical protein